MIIALLVPPEPTAQDFVGPWEVFSRWHGVTSLNLVGATPGLVRCDTGLEVNVPYGFVDVTAADVVVVPGGSNPYAAMDDTEAISWLQRLAPTATWLGSVCTGAAVLARAGLLDGKKATTHWAFRDELRGMGVDVCDERVVVAGNVITSAGVTAGIDMALTMTLLQFGSQMAEAVQLSLEYDPAPPTDSGTPAKSDPVVLSYVTAFLEAGVLSKNPARRK